MREQSGTVWAAQDLTTSVNSPPVSVSSCVFASFQIVLTAASSLNGSFQLQASNDPGQFAGDNDPAKVTGISNWVNVAGANQAVSANGVSMINYANFGCKWLRLAYTATAGDATANVIFSGKGF